MAHPLYVAFIWHQHQPLYKSRAEQSDVAYRLPWVRLHGTKDYLDLVLILERYPQLHQTVNLVPSLILQLEEYIVRLREELDREREERNYFQLERDKVNTFWEITKRQYEERKADLRNKEREMEEAEERHQVEIKVYKQKVKHLLYEHQNNITELKAESK